MPKGILVTRSQCLPSDPWVTQGREKVRRDGRTVRVERSPREVQDTGKGHEGITVPIDHVQVWGGGKDVGRRDDHRGP